MDDKYNTLKSRLISAFKDSETRQFQKFVSEMVLGDQKPSQLLRRMRDLAKKKVCRWNPAPHVDGSFTPAVRAVLIISNVKDLDKLTRVADTVMVNIRTRSEVAQVSAAGH